MNQYSEKYVDQLEVQIAEQQTQIEELKKENEELSNLCFEFGILRKAQEK